MLLSTIGKPDVFHTSIPAVPMGKYAHFIVLRETNSFALFQTDQQLNFAKVNAGRENSKAISRIVMFKRKQTTPERLTGRELLRRYGLVQGEDSGKERYCEYNSADFCKVCPDCVYYGFAIGSEGSERSKVMVDSAFSLTDFDYSHQAFTFNAPYEHGTMSKEGETKSSFGEQDHVLPQIVFPAVVTIHDPTEAEFIYVLNNLLRTKRYGAQTTRTGSLENHLIGIVFSDGEIFSNLKLTQTLYDKLGDQTTAPHDVRALTQIIEGELDGLLKVDGVTVHLKLTGDALAQLTGELGELVSQETRLSEFLQQAYRETEQYARTHGAKQEKKGKSAKSTKAKPGDEGTQTQTSSDNNQ
jgi:CRISPR-associated protein Csc2